jgi:hypothetical protein
MINEQPFAVNLDGIGHLSNDPVRIEDAVLGDHIRLDIRPPGG